MDWTLPQAIRTGMFWVAIFALGWLADHVADRVLIMATMLILAAATVGAGWLHPGWTASRAP